MADVNVTDFQRMRAEHRAMQAEMEMWRTRYHKLEEKYAQLEVTHAELMNVTGAKPKRVYEYGESECRPVSLGEVCPKCQYDYRRDSPRFMMRPNDKAKEVHPTTHV